MNDKNIKYNNNNIDKTNTKNKFDNGKKNAQNSKKEGKVKKPFEVRVGDWTCSKCNNLNFSFRNKCNRCGIPKEYSDKCKSFGVFAVCNNMNDVNKSLNNWLEK